MRKLTATILALGLACWMAAVLWESPVPEPVAATGALEGPGIPTPDPPAGAEPSVVGREAAQSGRREAAAEESVAPGSITLRGTAVARMADGMEFRGEDGSFRIRSESVGLQRRVEVRGGRWEIALELPEGADPADLGRASISNFVLRSRRGDPFPETIGLDAQGELEVGCLWTASHFLRVKDAATGEHLTGVRLTPASGRRLPPSGPVDPSTLEHSPFVFEPRIGSLSGDDVRIWWVGAVEHEWVRIALDHRRGGDRTITLRRAGELEVSWSGEAPPGPVLQVNALDGHDAPRLVSRRTLAAGSPQRFEGLGPGRYEVELRRTRRAGRLLLQREVVVGGGSRATLHLDLDPLATATATVEVGGTLQVHSGWRGLGPLFVALRPEVGSLTARWEPKDAAHRRVSVGEAGAPDGAGDVRAWQIPDVVPGLYSVEVGPLEGAVLLSEQVEVGQAGAPALALRVGPPSQLAIDVRVGESGSPLLAGATSARSAGLDLSFRASASDGRYDPLHGALDPETGVFHALLPPGAWELSVFHEDFAWVREGVHLGSAPQRVSIALEGSDSLELRLVCEGWPIPAERAWFRAIEITDASGEALPFGLEMIGSMPGRARLFMASRGPYRLDCPPLNGFAALQAVLDAGPGGAPTVIELERRFAD